MSSGVRDLWHKDDTRILNDIQGRFEWALDGGPHVACRFLANHNSIMLSHAAGLTEFQIEVGAHRAPINELWEPRIKD